MTWIIVIVALIIVAAIVIAFLNRFYRKATREVALVRTGAGGQRVVMDGGCLVLPFLHQVSEVNMRTMPLVVNRSGDDSVITEDRLRVDVSVEFYVRVEPTREGIATAAQALGSKSFRSTELAELIEGKLVDAMQNVAARQTMDSLHENRADYVRDISAEVAPNLAQNGLQLESVSLTRLDQTPFHALSEDNAFNAVGMRRLAEVIASNRKQRAAIEADAEVSVRQSQLDATKRKLAIDQEEEQAQISQGQEIATMKAASTAEIAERQAESERRSQQARIARERDVRGSEIEKDRDLQRLEIDKEKDLRKADMAAKLETELNMRDNSITTALKRKEELQAEAEAELARTEIVTAEEKVRTEKERAVAERAREISLIRAREDAEVDDVRVASETGTTVAKAKAEAEAVNLRAEAKKFDMVSESEGKAALVAAENALSDEIIKMRVDLHKLDTLPDLLREMVKPAEKIEHIRINQISGFGGTGTGGTGAGGDKPLVNQAVDSILGMALQMPALKRLGEEIGVSVTEGIDGVMQAAKDTGEGAGNQNSSESSSSGEAEDQGEKA